MVLRMIVGLGLTVVAFAIAGRRVWWLKRLAFTGQPAPERLEYARRHPGREAETQLTEVIEVIDVSQLLIRAVKLREGAAGETG